VYSKRPVFHYSLNFWFCLTTNINNLVVVDPNSGEVSKLSISEDLYLLPIAFLHCKTESIFLVSTMNFKKYLVIGGTLNPSCWRNYTLQTLDVILIGFFASACWLLHPKCRLELVHSDLSIRRLCWRSELYYDRCVLVSINVWI